MLWPQLRHLVPTSASLRIRPQHRKALAKQTKLDLKWILIRRCQVMRSHTCLQSPRKANLTKYMIPSSQLASRLASASPRPEPDLPGGLRILIHLRPQNARKRSIRCHLRKSLEPALLRDSPWTWIAPQSRCNSRILLAASSFYKPHCPRTPQPFNLYSAHIARFESIPMAFV
jgi:hypothetical protein